MCMGGGAPAAIPAAAPLPPPTPPPPTAVDPAVLAARQNVTANAKAAAGLGSTIPDAALDSTTTGAKKTLLGV